MQKINSNFAIIDVLGDDRNEIIRKFKNKHVRITIDTVVENYEHDDGDSTEMVLYSKDAIVNIEVLD